MSRANSSRERILASAEALILQQGFSATSIEEIIDKAAITKGGFFYHFENKATLAQALVERYLQQDDVIFTDLFNKAEELSEDPLHQLLIFLKLLADTMSALESAHPGCLVVSFTYESHQFDDEIRALIRQGLLGWRGMIASRLHTISEKYPMKGEVTIDALADMFISSIEGGIILSRAFQDNQLLVNQLLTYRQYLRLLFE